VPKGVYARRPRPPKQYPAEVVAKVSELYSRGMTQVEVAAEMGLTQRVVFNVMRHHGIEARPAAKRDQSGARNANWKGDGASYQALHRRLYALFGKPTRCKLCGTEDAPVFDYANLTGRYEDVSDYAPMCRSCHAKYDRKILNIAHMREAENA
jgi:hypothetical protein